MPFGVRRHGRLAQLGERLPYKQNVGSSILSSPTSFSTKAPLPARSVWMSPKLLIRIAAGCVLFFAVGHSIGHATRKASQEPGALAVYKVMEEYKFPIGPQMRSYDEFYTGMSLNLTITLLVMTVVLWILSGQADAHHKLTRALLLPLVALFAGFTATSALYFFVVPMVTCAVSTILLTAAWLRLRS